MTFWDGSFLYLPIQPLSLISLTDTTAFIKALPGPSSTSFNKRVLPSADLLAFFSQNFEFGNLENANSFGAGTLPVNVTFPVIVPPAWASIGATSSPAPARSASVSDRRIIMCLPPYNNEMSMRNS